MGGDTVPGAQPASWPPLQAAEAPGAQASSAPLPARPAAVPHEHLLSVCVVGTDFGGTVVVR